MISLPILILVSFLITTTYSLKSKVNINCGGPSNWRFQSDETGLPWWLKVWGNPNSYAVTTEYVGAEQRNVYALESHRWNPRKGFGYKILGMKPGQYECTLHFAETSSFFAEPGKRVFRGQINGLKTDAIDVYGITGKMYKSHTRTIRHIPVKRSSKSLKVNMIPIKGDPMLSAITCIKEKPKKYVLLNHMYLNCGGETFEEFTSDTSKQLEHYVVRWGTTRTYNAPKNQFSYPRKWKLLLHSERYSVVPHNFGYKLKNLQADYWQCKFYFAETYWNAPGKRVILLKVNGMQRYVDVYKAVGKFKKHTVSFPRFYSSGEINISFIRYKGDPMISALECTLA